jgi:hypothetical protein
MVIVRVMPMTLFRVSFRVLVNVMFMVSPKVIVQARFSFIVSVRPKYCIMVMFRVTIRIKS